MKRVLMSLMVAGLVIGSVGCASSGRVGSLEAKVDQLQSETAAANRTASEALSTAQAAADTAAAADARAADAQACCNANTERLDRMFKRSMYK